VLLFLQNIIYRSSIPVDKRGVHMDTFALLDHTIKQKDGETTSAH
jgi:hypothetical protein